MYIYILYYAYYILALYSRNLLRQTTRDPQNQSLLSDVLLIRVCLLCVHYYSNQIVLKKCSLCRGAICLKGVSLNMFLLDMYVSIHPNNAQKLACVEEQLVLRVLLYEGVF